ncbi:MAG: ureidoglycolate lyase [Clostridiales Family XIII bacterium]|jgi:ureidoglycolate lyase|nr:ureidoglycolate lyase [Clostridiales Family XIII bacterium]
MITVNAKPISPEAFAKYGRVSDALGKGEYYFDLGSCHFHRDMIQQNLSRETVVSYSICHAFKRPMLIDWLEYHNYTEETIMPIDSDVIACFAPAIQGQSCPKEEIEAFIVKAGAIVTCRPGVWHGIPFIKGGAKDAHILCVLPERTYEKDGFVEAWEGKEQVKVLTK